jgi:hypothetical protein
MKAAAFAGAIAKHHSLFACVRQASAVRWEGVVLFTAAMRTTAASAQADIFVATGLQGQAV